MSCKPLTKKEWESSVADAFSLAVKSTYQDLIDEAVKAERQWFIDSGLIGVLKHCEDLLRDDGHEDAVDDVQNMIAKIKSRMQA